MKEGGGADDIRLMAAVAAIGHGVFQAIDGGEMRVVQRFIAEAPQMLGEARFGRVGWSKDEVDALGRLNQGTAVVASLIEHQDDALVWPRVDRLREGGRTALIMAVADAGGELPFRTAIQCVPPAVPVCPSPIPACGPRCRAGHGVHPVSE